VELSRDQVEQRAFGRAIGAAATLGIAALGLVFAAYLAGWLPASVPLDRLPQVWSQPAEAHLAEAGLAPGWRWMLAAGWGDFAALLPIAWLASSTAPALLVVMVHYARRRQMLYLALSALQIMVLALAASGIFTLGH
jgi:hypothetical protein